MYTFRTNCAVAKRTTEAFVQRVNVGGVSQRMEYEKQVVWILESSSRRVYMHGGEELKESGSFNDHYGFLTSMDQVEEAKSLCATYKIDEASSLELVILLTVHLRPCVETEECLAHNAKAEASGLKRMYAEVPNEWRKEEMRDGERYWPTLEPEIIAKDVLVWTSKSSDAENEARAAAARDLYGARLADPVTA